MSTYSTLISGEPSLVNYWQLNESSGTAATDSKGTYTLTYSGGFTLGQAGIAGAGGDTGVAFNGSTGKAQATPTGTLNAPYTVEAWIKTSSASFLGAFFNTRAPNYAEFRVNSGSVGALVGNGGSTWYTTSLGNTWTYADGQWHHAVLVVTATTAAIYFDGILIASVTYSSGSPRLWDTGTAIQLGGYSAGGEWWNGNVSQVAVYNSALTGATIQRHYRAGIGGTIPSSLAAKAPPHAMTVPTAARRTVLFHAPCGRYGLAAPTDVVSGGASTPGATAPTVIPSPWGNALNFTSGTNQVAFPKSTMPPVEGPFTLAFLGRINGPPVIVGGSRAAFVSTTNGGAESLTLMYTTTIGNPISLFKGIATISSGLYPRWGAWAFYAATWDGKSIQNFYVYDWELNVFQSASVSESTLSSHAGESAINPSIGPITFGNAGNSSQFDLVAAVIDRTAWGVTDFMRFAADPFYPLRPRPAAAFFGAAAPAPIVPVRWPAALLPAM